MATIIPVRFDVAPTCTPGDGAAASTPGAAFLTTPHSN